MEYEYNDVNKKNRSLCRNNIRNNNNIISNDSSINYEYDTYEERNINELNNNGYDNINKGSTSYYNNVDYFKEIYTKIYENINVAFFIFFKMLL